MAQIDVPSFFRSRSKLVAILRVALLCVVFTLSNLRSVCGQPDPEKNLKKGKKAFSESQFLPAEQFFRKSADWYRGKDDEKFFYSQNRLGDVLRIAGKEHQAEKLLLNAEAAIRRKYPNSLLLADCEDILGELYFYISDIERAGMELLPSITGFPTSMPSMYAIS